MYLSDLIFSPFYDIQPIRPSMLAKRSLLPASGFKISAGLIASLAVNAPKRKPRQPF